MNKLKSLSRERLPESQLVRAFAIIGVLSVHSTSYAVSAMTDSKYFYVQFHEHLHEIRNADIYIFEQSGTLL